MVTNRNAPSDYFSRLNPFIFIVNLGPIVRSCENPAGNKGEIIKGFHFSLCVILLQQTDIKVISGLFVEFDVQTMTKPNNFMHLFALIFISISLFQFV